jgi:hypothetical protein
MKITNSLLGYNTIQFGRYFLRKYLLSVYCEFVSVGTADKLLETHDE